MYHSSKPPKHLAILPIIFGCLAMLSIMVAVGIVSKKPVKEPEIVMELEALSTPAPQAPKQDVSKPETKPAVELPLITKPTVHPTDIPLKALEVNLTVHQPKAFMTSMPILTPSLAHTLEDIQRILNAKELDTSPSILPPYPNFQYPAELTKRGIKSGKVVVVVIIDENGNAKVESIESATHPKLRAVATKIVNGARFSPPRYQGQLVKARYRWPLQLGAPS